MTTMMFLPSTLLRTAGRCLLLLLLSSLLWEGSYARQQNPSQGGGNNPDCHAFGCTFLPRDIIFDQPARKALESLHLDDDSTVAEITATAAAAEEELALCGGKDFVTLTLIGYKGGSLDKQINQDRATIVTSFGTNRGATESGDNGNDEDDGGLFVGVFDGHGNLGEYVSEYARKEVPKRIAAKLDQTESAVPSEDDVVAILKDTFLEVNATTPAGTEGGCTSTVALRLGSKLYIANAGDSRTMLAVRFPNGQADLLYVTREDKPDLPDERERIEGMGGSISVPPKGSGGSSRVLFTDPQTGMRTGLAMSRSIGDWKMVGVVAEPIVRVFDLAKEANTIAEGLEMDCDGNDADCKKIRSTDIRFFVVSASDGMMDYIDPSRIVTAFADAFYEHTEEEDPGRHPLLVADYLIHESAKGWHNEMGGQYRDDIVVAAAKLV